MPIVCTLDIETTGLDALKGHRIIEIACVLNDLNTGKFLGKWESRINPKRAIDPKAQAVHGISLEDLKEAHLWEDVAPKLLKIFKKADLLIGHNADGFDLPFILHEFERIGIDDIPDVATFDTMTCRWATPNGKPPSLKELAHSLGYEYDLTKAHAALYDVILTAKCFFTARQRYPGFIVTPFDKSAVTA